MLLSLCIFYRNNLNDSFLIVYTDLLDFTKSMLCRFIMFLLIKWESSGGSYKLFYFHVRCLLDILLKQNVFKLFWHTISKLNCLYLKYMKCCFDKRKHCKVITSIKLIDASITSHSYFLCVSVLTTPKT
jgi:hypothetical protein